jgi:hypothetical protein
LADLTGPLARPVRWPRLANDPAAIILKGVDVQAQGWYRDPYRVHQDRYFSAGWPTKLVRDHGQESYDLPPDRPPPDDDLVPVPPKPMLRPDPASGEPADDADRVLRAVFDYFDQLPF